MNSQLDTTNESQEVSPFPAVDHKACINKHAHRHSKQKTKKPIKDPQKKSCDKINTRRIQKHTIYETFQTVTT